MGFPRMMIRSGLSLFAFIACMFLLAGRTDYWQGWVFAAYLLALFVVIAVLFRDKQDLLAERSKPGPGMKWWDKVFFAFFVPSYLVILVICPLDAGRFYWSPALPVAAYAVGNVAFLLSNVVFIWAMWVNRWFSSVVRIQTDRDQQVVQEGPYRFVRHPGYVGAIPMMLSMPIILGSLWGLVPGGLGAIALLIRTHLEDKTLINELDGYAAYAKKIRYRLLPGVW